MRFCFLSIAVAWMIVSSGLASAQTVFIEGHVFNKFTGVPLSGAVVRVLENITVGPLPIVLAVGVTDANGFYQFEVDDFLGASAIIEVVCGIRKGEIRGRSSATLREGLIHRDVYLTSKQRLTRCQPVEPG